MKRALLAGIAVVALAAASQSAVAADLPRAPVMKAGPVAAPLFDWTGFYVGATAGYGWGRSEQFAPSVSATTGEYDIDGFVAGGTVGYNWQTGPWVFGLEADLSYSGIDGATSSSPTWGCVVPNGCVTEVDWFGTGRIRAGYAANNWLAYLTGGVAFGEVKAGYPGTSGSDTRTGWTAGAGVEYAFAPNWSAKLEYLYVDLGDFVFAGGTPGNVAQRAKAEFSVVRVGLNYRFATGKAPAPVMTRY